MIVSDAMVTDLITTWGRSPIDHRLDSRHAPGSIVADMAAERGGNCELTVPGEDVDIKGVLVMGPTNIPSTVPYHASQLYARNWITFWDHLPDASGNLRIHVGDEITRETLVTRGGEVVNERVIDAWKD